MFEFEVEVVDSDSEARNGRFYTPHGIIPTPVFAPVGTAATVKALRPADLHELGVNLILSNTYHLYLRPGDELIRDLGGLHTFMGWDGPILTDSGGFQVFSLSDTRKIDADGVTFQSHLDGSYHRFTPEKSIGIQEKLGADIIMAFDECPPPHDYDYVKQSLSRTHSWLERCVAAKTRSDQALFGIVQGGIFPDLREASARFMMELDLPGYAIGGLAVGETKAEMAATLDSLI
jgi:queuine tRNA-ribosyltransferase